MENDFIIFCERKMIYDLEKENFIKLLEEYGFTPENINFVNLDIMYDLFIGLSL